MRIYFLNLVVVLVFISCASDTSNDPQFIVDMAIEVSGGE